MANTQLFDPLTVGVASLDTQTALAVQSLLESQSVAEPPADAEDDMFQCGKCKKTFTVLSAFVTHKQSQCTNQTVDTSPTLTSQTLGQSVLTDDMNLTLSIDPSLQSALQTATIQGNPFLSQVASAPITLTPLGQKPAPQGEQEQPLQSFFITPSQPGAATIQPSQLQDAQVIAASAAPLQPLGCTLLATQPVLTANPISVTSQVTLSSSVTSTAEIVPRGLTLALPKIPNQNKTVRRPGMFTVNVDENGTIKKTRVKGLATQENSGDKKLRCVYCEKGFAKNFDLQQHVRSHTGEKPYQCIVCGRAFAQKSNVKKHMQTHKVWPTKVAGTLPEQPEPKVIRSLDHESETISSDVLPDIPGVNKMSVQKTQAGKNVQIVIDNTYCCQYCAQKFKTYFQLKTHMVQHKTEQVYKCVLKTCRETFPDLDGFLEHIKTHESSMTYSCHVCTKSFPSLYDLGLHQYSHSLYPNQVQKTGPRYYRCMKCNSKYSTADALEQHMLNTSHHYKCKYCDKVFTCERYLRRHLPIHGTEGQYTCDVCEKHFKTEHYLKTHMLIHSGEKPFPCDQCDATFNRKDKLKRHVLIHEPVKKFKCPLRSHIGCLKEFHRADKLKAHIIAHSGIRPYRCGQCGKTFSRRPHLQEHEKIHDGTYSYSCDRCGKGFFREKLYKEHMEKVVCEEAEELPAAPLPVRFVHTGRRSKRKVGRPRKRIISVTEETVNRPKRRPGRPRKHPLPEQKVPETSAAPAAADPDPGVLPADPGPLADSTSPTQTTVTDPATSTVTMTDFTEAGQANMQQLAIAVTPEQIQQALCMTSSEGSATLLVDTDGNVLSADGTTIRVSLSEQSSQPQQQQQQQQP